MKQSTILFICPCYILVHHFLSKDENILKKFLQNILICYFIASVSAPVKQNVNSLGLL